jgi:hypothetical protein
MEKEKIELSSEGELVMPNNDDESTTVGVVDEKRDDDDIDASLQSILSSVDVPALKSGDCRHLCNDLTQFLALRSKVMDKKEYQSALSDIEAMNSGSNEHGNSMIIDTPALAAQVTTLSQYCNLCVSETLLLTALQEGQIPEDFEKGDEQVFSEVRITILQDVVNFISVIPQPSSSIQERSDIATMLLTLRQEFSVKNWISLQEALSTSQTKWNNISSHNKTKYRAVEKEMVSCAWQLQHQQSRADLIEIIEQLVIARVQVSLENYNCLTENMDRNAELVTSANQCLASGTSLVLSSMIKYVSNVTILRQALFARDTVKSENMVKVLNASLPSLIVSAHSKSVQRGEISHAVELVEYFQLYNSLVGQLCTESDPGSASDAFISNLVSSKEAPYMRNRDSHDAIRTHILSLQTAVSRFEGYDGAISQKASELLEVAQTVLRFKLLLCEDTFTISYNFYAMSANEWKNRVVEIQDYISDLCTWRETTSSDGNDKPIGYYDYTQIEAELVLRSRYRDLSLILQQCQIVGSVGNLTIEYTSAEIQYNSLKEALSTSSTNGNQKASSPSLLLLQELVEKVLNTMSLMDTQQWSAALEAINDCNMENVHYLHTILPNLDHMMEVCRSEVSFNLAKQHLLSSICSLSYVISKDGCTLRDEAGVTEKLRSAVRKFMEFKSSNKHGEHLTSYANQILDYICPLLTTSTGAVRNDNEPDVGNQEKQLLDLEALMEATNAFETPLPAVSTVLQWSLFTTINNQLLQSIQNSVNEGTDSNSVGKTILRIRMLSTPLSTLLPYITAVELYECVRNAYESNDLILQHHFNIKLKEALTWLDNTYKVSKELITVLTAALDTYKVQRVEIEAASDAMRAMVQAEQEKEGDKGIIATLSETQRILKTSYEKEDRVCIVFLLFSSHAYHHHDHHKNHANTINLSCCI